MGLVVQAQLLQRPGPAVALIGHQFLQHAQGEAGALAIHEFQRPAKARDMGKAALFGEVVHHLAVGIGPGAGPPEELENQLLPIANRGVALLRATAAGGQHLAGIAAQGVNQPPRHPGKRASRETHFVAAFDHAQQPLAETVVHRGVEPGALAALTGGKQGIAVLVPHTQHAIGRHAHQGNEVRFPVTLGVAHVEQQERGGQIGQVREVAHRN